MGKITDIVKQKRNATRVSVFIDGEFVCGLDAVTAVAARISIGDEITAERLLDIVHASEVNSAFERAAGYISRSPRSKREIERYLADKGYDKAVAQEAVARLVSYRYIDDFAYAKSYIKSKSKKYGRMRLTAELKKRGVDADMIAELLSGEEFDEYSGEAYEEDDGALLAANKYLKSHKSADIPKLKRFLAGRGFTWDAINAAVRSLQSDGALTADDDDNI